MASAVCERQHIRAKAVMLCSAAILGVFAHGQAPKPNARLEVRLLVENAMLPVWSPDGRYLLFQHPEDQAFSLVFPRYAIRRLGIAEQDGDNLKILTSDLVGVHRFGKWIRWSPDSQWIAYIIVTDKGDALEKIRPNGKDRKRLLTYDCLTDCAWSPDGKLIAVWGEDKGWIVQADDGKRMPFAKPKGYEAKDILWSPDGKKIAYSAVKPRVRYRSELWVADLMTNKCWRVVAQKGMVEFTAIEWLPDGKRLSVARCTNRVDGNAVYGQVDRGTILSDGSGKWEDSKEEHFALRRTIETVLWSAEIPRPWCNWETFFAGELLVIKNKQTGSQYHPFPDRCLYYGGGPAFSPDGKFLAVEVIAFLPDKKKSGRDAERVDLYVIRLPD